MATLNLREKFTRVRGYFSPKIIGAVNDVYVKIAVIKGEAVPWHNHEYEDELFYIVEGSLFFEIEGQPGFTMNAGDLYIVKKGVNHRVSSKKECKIMMIENKTTAHTGKVKTDITKTLEQQM